MLFLPGTFYFQLCKICHDSCLMCYNLRPFFNFYFSMYWRRTTWS